jgi:hypothetical protein
MTFTPQSFEDDSPNVKCDHCGELICSVEEFKENGEIAVGFCEIEIKGKGLKHFCSKNCFRLHMIKNLFKDPLLYIDSAGDLHCGEDCDNKADFLVDCDSGNELKYCKFHVDDISELTGITKITKILH